MSDIRPLWTYGQKHFEEIEQKRSIQKNQDACDPGSEYLCPVHRPSLPAEHVRVVHERDVAEQQIARLTAEVVDLTAHNERLAVQESDFLSAHGQIARLTAERNREVTVKDATAGTVEPLSVMKSQETRTEAQIRKEHPLATGCFDYFPDALYEIAHVSYVGNEQHNPGTPLHWDRTKSTDEADCVLRHFKDRGTRDTDGLRHTAKMAWRSLALLQKELEGEAK